MAIPTHENVDNGKSNDHEFIRTVIIDAVISILNFPETISLDASFPALGGDSIQALSLSLSCKRQGISLPVDAILRERSIVRLIEHAKIPNQTITSQQAGQQVSTPSPTHRKPSTRPEYNPYLQQRRGTTQTLDNNGTSFRSKDLQRTEMQLSLIAGSQQILGSNVILFLDTYKAEHIPAMKKAWTQVIEQEPIFQTSIGKSVVIGGDRHAAEDEIQWTEIAIQTKAQQEKLEGELMLDPSVNTSFSVVTLAHDNESDFTTIIWRIHHALIDGFAAAILYRKVHQAACGLSTFPGPPFKEVAVALEQFHEQNSASYAAYWKQKSLEFPSASGTVGLPPPIQPPTKIHTSRTTPIPIFGTQISKFARDNGVTLAAVHYSLWALVLSFYTNSDQVVFGAVLSGRSLPISGAAETIGPLINTLPFYTVIDFKLSIANFVVENFKRMLSLEVIQPSKSEDGFRRDFESAMALQVEIESPESSAFRPVKENSFRSVSAMPLSVMIQQNGGANLMYHEHKFHLEDMELLAMIYANAASSLVTPEMSLVTLMSTLLPNSCRQNILHFGNSCSPFTRQNSVSQDLVSLFEKVVLTSPSLIALVKGEENIAYIELDFKASQVARYLEKIVTQGEVVCIHADRSVNWIIGIYGILKAGCVYAPLDPALPSQVRSANFLASQSRVFLATDVTSKVSKPSSGGTCLSVSEILVEGAAPDPCFKRTPRQPRPKDTAYVSFTSGSTGTPKAVLCTHEGLVAFQSDKEVRLFSEPGCRISQVMSPAFDGSIHEIFSALSYGATLVLPPSDNLLAPLSSVDSTILTPSLANVLDPKSFPRLKNVYLVGEPVSQTVCDTWSSCKSLYNMYGPTETTCGATIKRLQFGESVTVGRPNRSCRIYILNDSRQLLAPGVIGEIYIAGIQVARGYLGQDNETAKKFLPDTVNPSFRERMYATGDRGLWTNKGELALTGRNDRQIKLKGFRLDLNALEASAARAIPEATAIAITCQEDDLIAAFQSSGIEKSDVRARLSMALPSYAMPKHILVLERLPLTTAGKMDYKAIAASTIVQRSYHQNILHESLSMTEQKIANIWRGILQLDLGTPITQYSNFSALGGHSILQLRLAGELSKAFCRQIQMRRIIEWRNLRDYGKAIDNLLSSTTRFPMAASTYTIGEHDISPTEKGWWDKYKFGGCTTSFNVSLLYTFDPKTINRQQLRIAWNLTLARYPILRSRFLFDSKSGVKKDSFESPPRAQRRKHFQSRREVNRPFILEKEHPIRVLISKKRILICASHIICDYTALRVLLKDVSDLYSGGSLEPIDRFYKDTLWKSPSAYETQNIFWRTYLAGIPDLQIPHLNNPLKCSCQGTSRIVQINSTLCRNLYAFTRQHNFTTHQIALAAVGLALQPSSHTVDLVLGSPWLNRSPEDLNTVGLFLEPLPMRVTYTPSTATESSEQFLRSVQRSSQSAIANAMPWPHLLSALGISAVLPHQPLFDVMVTFHDVPNEPLLPIEGFHQHATWSEGSKFKLMCEFTGVLEDKILLRLEYDNSCFTAIEVVRIEKRILKAIDSLVLKLTIAETRARMEDQGLTKVEHNVEVTPVAFGERL
ncbi:BcNRPS1, nonribosomal peptide synthetase [Halenospora varia]|nr:BcNRPS1, nonribosomal peptide synthetase [Halenospora varia]